LKHLKVFENFIIGLTENLDLKILNKDFKENFLSSSPKPTLDKFLSCGAVLKINDYTGIKTMESEYLNFGDSTIKIIKEEDNKIKIYISLSSSTVFIIPEGEIFYVRFDNGEVLKFKTLGDHPRVESGIRINYSTLLNPSREELEKFNKFSITGFKFYVIESTISKGQADVFRKILDCVEKTDFNSIPTEAPKIPGKTDF
jgi:hypothetical protein